MSRLTFDRTRRSRLYTLRSSFNQTVFRAFNLNCLKKPVILYICTNKLWLPLACPINPWNQTEKAHRLRNKRDRNSHWRNRYSNRKFRHNSEFIYYQAHLYYLNKKFQISLYFPGANLSSLDRLSYQLYIQQHYIVLEIFIVIEIKVIISTRNLFFTVWF